MNHQDVVIIGGGPAGRVIVHALHQAGQGQSVTLIKDEEVNVNRCAVPYGISTAKPVSKYLIPNDLVTDYGATMIVERAEHLDPHRSTITLVGGESIHYDHLVLATGSRPLIPPIPGIEASNITPVRSLHDLQRLREHAKQHRRAVVVGGGYIGVEVAVVLRQIGLDVTIVEMLPHVVQMTTDEDFIESIENDLTKHGIALVTNAKVTEFIRDGERCTAVTLENGHRIDADFVVLSMGVRPNVDLAEAAGLEVSPFGIVTDDHLRTSVSTIYASGDCAEKRSLITGQPTRGEFGTNAVFMSKVVAANILGREETFPGVLNANATTTFNHSLGSAGLIERVAKSEGVEYISGISDVLDRYPMMDHVAAIKTKLLFDASSERLIGGTVLRHGHGVAANIDFISMAIQMKVTIDDLLRLQYATHPELAAKPSDHMFVFAAKDAARKRVVTHAT